MNRYCPNCKKQLYAHSHYFCSNCGYVLSDDLIRPNIPLRIKKTKINVSDDTGKPSFNFKFKINRNTKITFVLLILIIILFFVSMFVIHLLEKRFNRDTAFLTQNIQPEEQNFTNTLDLNLTSNNYTFGSSNLHTYVPLDVDFYLESSDISLFIRSLLKENYENSVYLELLNNLSNEFAVYGKKVEDSWILTLVLKVNDLSNATQAISSINLNGWEYQFINEALVITNTPEEFAKITQSSKKIIKNVSHSTKYSSYKALLPKDGQLLFMSFMDKERDYFEPFSLFSFNTYINEIVNSLRNSGYEMLVLRK